LEEKDTSTKNASQDKGVLDYVWKFFCSLKLTVFLLIILAIVSILGTIIDQSDPGKNMNGLIRLLGDPKSAEVALNWLVKLGLTSMYKSWWFVGLLAMLCANITACSIDRLPGVFKVISRQMKPLTDDSVKSFKNRQTLTLGGSLSEAERKVGEAMKSSGFGYTKAEKDGEIHLMSESGRYGRLGVYVTHLSVIIIFVGAIIGALWGFKGYVQIQEGESIDKIWLREVPLIPNKNIVVEGPNSRYYQANFSVRCDKFELKEYKFRNRPTGMPSDYISHLTVLQDGREVTDKQIEVNSPLKYQSIKFYQSSYGQSPANAIMTIRVRSLNGSEPLFRDYSLKKGQRTKIEGSEYEMMLTDLSPDVVVSAQNELVPQSDQYKGRGAAIVAFFNAAGDVVDKAVILDVNPRSQPRNIPYSLDIVNYTGSYYTGLQVTYDPGVWVVYGGFIIMVLGIFVAFFMVHRRVWARIRTDEKGRAVVTVAGSVNKNRQAFARVFDKFADKLRS